MVGALLTGSHSQARLDKALSESSAMVGIDVASLHVDVAAIGAELPASLARTSKTDRIDAATLAERAAHIELTGQLPARKWLKMLRALPEAAVLAAPA